MLPFKKLALGAGGIKGILHLGALRELSKYQPLSFPDGIYGCSIGSIIATYVSFNLPIDDKVIDLTKKYLSMDRVVPKLTFQQLTGALASKGVFDMNQFETVISEFFCEVGIDIRSKKIGDADMPLYIVASNITKGVPTIFSKDVPIMDALKCSCAIPGVFKPQELYGQLYIDGGVFVPCLNSIAPDSLNLSLVKQRRVRITPKTVDSISPLTFMSDVYAMAINQMLINTKTETTVDLEYPDLHSDSDLEDFNVEDIVNNGSKQLHSFLTSKSLLKE